MKKFEVVNNKFYCVKKAGYELDFSCETEYDFPEDFSENRQDEEFDSFFELYSTALCKDEKGELYAVKFNFGNNEPMIWQKLKKI